MNYKLNLQRVNFLYIEFKLIRSKISGEDLIF